MRWSGHLLGAAVALVVAGGPAVPATAAQPAMTGISDAGTAFFDEPHYRALDLHTVRLVLPWDAGMRKGPWDAWLARAARDGADVMVALSHDEASRCPGAPCVLPPDAAYGDALRALVTRHPQIREVVPWNEPNHGSQPTARDPEAAARFVAQARAACPHCVIVAGNLLDDASMPGYLARYQRALGTTPDVWGLHSYWDTTYFTSGGIDHMLRAVDGPVWLTETGGLVSFGALPHDEQRAAASVRWAYALADARPRVGRLYLHQWQGTPTNPFDSGLLDYFGRPRPAYGVVAARVGRRDRGAVTAVPGATASGGSVPTLTDGGRAAMPTAAANLHVSGRSLRLLSRRRLELRLSCTAPRGQRCRNVIRIRAFGRVRKRIRVTLRPGRTVRRRIKLSRAVDRALRRTRRPRAGVQICPRNGRCERPRTVRVARSSASRTASPRRPSRASRTSSCAALCARTASAPSASPAVWRRPGRGVSPARRGSSGWGARRTARPAAPANADFGSG